MDVTTGSVGQTRRSQLRGHITATAAAAIACTAALLAAPAQASGHVRFATPVALPGGAAHTEPSLVVDSAGRAFVSAIPGLETNTTGGELGSPIWRSTDYAHWTKLRTASVGPQGSPFGGGDSALAL